MPGSPDAKGPRALERQQVPSDVARDRWLPRQTFHVGSAPVMLDKGRGFRRTTAVKTQRPIITDDEHVVLKFRPRTSDHPPTRREQADPAKAQPAASDLSRYERPRDEPDDFRH